MTRIYRKTSIVVMLSMVLLSAAALWAQRRHPMYLRARSDLRRAILLMRIPDEPNVMRDMQQASGLAERAIREVDAAAMFDRRDLEDNPPVDTHLGRGGRFREPERTRDAADHRPDDAGSRPGHTFEQAATVHRSGCQFVIIVLRHRSAP